jgi:hypothetical protein
MPDRYQNSIRYFGLLAPYKQRRTKAAALNALLRQTPRPHPPRLLYADSIKRDFGYDPLIESKGQRMTRFSDELAGKSRELSELEAVVKAKDEKLLVAQNAQAELIRKQPELDDAKLELDLTVQTRVQESLTVIRDKAKHKAEEELKLKISERDGGSRYK